MKKLLLFVCMFLLIPIRSLAGTMDSLIKWDLDMGVVAHQIRNGEEKMTNLANIRANDKVAYCIEPGVTAQNNGTYNSSYNINDTILKNVDIKKLSLIGYYGYGYRNHTTKEFYMAAQELIWRMLGVENVWWTDKKYGGNKFNIEKEKNEIMSFVNSYELTPELDLDKTYLVGDTVEIKDKNNVIYYYTILNSNTGLSLGMNSLKVLIKDKTYFTLGREDNDKKPIYYYKNGYQTIGTFDAPSYKVSKEYNIKSVYGKIYIEKFDNDNKNKTPLSKEASLENAEFIIEDYNTKKIIDTKKTDKDGKLVFDNLTKGTYRIYESKASKGYNKVDKDYVVHLDSNKKETTLNFYEPIIKNKINIKKVLDYNDDKNYVPEKDIKFGIYDFEDKLVYEGLTNDEGEINITLPYGMYKIKQLSTKEGINKVKDKIINVTSSNKIQNITLINHKLPVKKIVEEPEVITEIEELPDTGISLNYFPIILAFLFMVYVKKNY